MPPVREQAEFTGSVQATAVEPQATVELERLEHPYLRWEQEASLSANVPPGRYRSSFRIGGDTFSMTDFEVVEGDRVRVVPTTPPSALLTEAGLAAPDAETTLISETIGPIQAEVLPTMLSLLGIMPFDPGGMITDELSGLVPSLDAASFGNQPVVAVIAVEGDRWAPPVESVVNGITCELHSNEPLAGVPIPLQPLGPPGHGYGRIKLGVAPPPSASFGVVINSPHFGRIELATASLPNRVTVVTCTLHPDGTIDVSQNLMRLPGRENYPEPVPNIPYARMVRELQLASKLFKGGRLIRYVDRADTEVIGELLHAKWTDPIVGCMAYYAWADAGRAGLTGWHVDAALKLQVTAANLRTYFGELPDARVIAALSDEDQRPVLVDELLERNEVPVLRRSVSELAQFARDRGAFHSPIVRLDARLPLAEGWAFQLEPRARIITNVARPAARPEATT